jgi:integrase
MTRRSLTVAAVQRIKPPKRGQVEHFDKGYPGLALRVSYGGGKSWAFFYRIGGKLRRMTLGTFPAISLAEAREAWREARQDVATGRDPSRSAGRSPHDFSSVANDWLKRDQGKNKSRAEVKRVVDRELVPAWGHRAVSDIGRRDILDLIDGIADRGSPIMARRVHAYVHRLFKWAVWRGIVGVNPASGLPKPGSETERDRVLSDEEVVSIWKAAQKIGWPFGPALQLLMLTGARREEISQLQWLEIDIKNAVISLAGERTKNGKPHDIHLSKPALTLLSKLPRVADSEFVFTLTGQKPIHGWSGIKADLPIENWRIHDLRRTAATGLQKLGTPLQVTEAILGHVAGSRSGIVGVYQRYTYDAERRSALEAWGKHVMALVR